MRTTHGKQCACVYCRCEINECSIEVGDSGDAAKSAWWYILHGERPPGDYNTGELYTTRRSAVRRAKQVATKFRWGVARVFDCGSEE